MLGCGCDACLQVLEPEVKSHTTFAAIKKQLAAGKNPLADADFWAVVNDWRASHPGAGLTTKVVLVTALNELLEAGPTGTPRTSALPELVAQFRAEESYSERDRLHRDGERDELALALSPGGLANPDARLLSRLAGPAYGFPGRQPGYYTLMQTDEGVAEAAETFRYLLYGSGDVADRLEDCIRGLHKLPGVAEAMMVKALAVADPERWFPSHVTTGKVGKFAVLNLLGEKPPTHLAPGAAAVASNDWLRQILDPYFPGDPWGIQEFTWWLLHRDPVPADTDWTGAEIAATVADYLTMLTMETAGQHYSKTAHQHALRPRLSANRTDRAIERKHQNISAAMIELGLPYIRGYKPLGNFQEALSARCSVASEQTRDDWDSWRAGFFGRSPHRSASAQRPAAACFGKPAWGIRRKAHGQTPRLRAPSGREH